MKPVPTTHCIHGHALNSETLYVGPKGTRKCRVCEKTRYRITKDKRKNDGPTVAGRPSPEMVADAKRRASVLRGSRSGDHGRSASGAIGARSKARGSCGSKLMAQTSTIEWTDATVNFWWGCTKVGPGCDHCYAETWSKRTGGNIWGVGVPRRKIKSAPALIHQLDNGYADWAADHSCGLLPANCGLERRVFIQSMSDLFDIEVPVEWFAEAWDKIEVCNRLAIQIVTKRISVVEKRLAAIGRASWPRHAGLMITVVNQDEADRDIPRLIALKAKLGIPWIGLSIEPMLGPVDLGQPQEGLPSNAWLTWLDALDWVICGGESGRHARPMHPDWARSLRDQCSAAGVPLLFKQWGEWAPADEISSEEQESYDVRGLTDDGVVRIGKKRAGRLLDGVEHNGFPDTRKIIGAAA